MARRIIQVGVGAMGRHWLEAILRSQQWELVALVDTNRETLRQVMEQYSLAGKSCFSDLEEALSKVEAEAVLDVTPPSSRKEVCLRALSSGKHVLSEKPLADTLENAKIIVEAAEKAGRLFMVSQSYRFQPAPRTIKKIIFEREIGEIGYVTISFHKGVKFPGTFREIMDYPLVVDMSIHHFDLMRFLLGKEPLTVQARSWRPSWSRFRGDPCVNCTFEFNGGFSIHYLGSWVARGFETSWNGEWRIEGSHQTLHWREEGVFLSSSAEEFQPLTLLSMPVVGLDYALEEFHSAITEGRVPETSAKDNLKSLAMVFATLKSIESGEKISMTGD